MNLENIQAYIPKVYALAEKHGIARIYLAGSIARGDSGAKSDVDFLVEMKPDASFFGVAGFLYEAEQLLGVPVDVIPLSLLSDMEEQDFAANIQQDLIVL